MDKQIKYVVAVVLLNKKGEYLAVKRPDDDPDLGGAWGLPATTMTEGELPEAAALRVCHEKLNCSAKSTHFLGLMNQKRNKYNLFLMDIKMELVDGSEPDVSKAISTHTEYTEQKWTNDPNVLMPSAKQGSCCCSIFLTDRGLLKREEWIDSLEGSSLVD